jgi:hypothetical protein
MLTRILRQFTQSPDGYLHGPALDTVVSQGTAIGASLAATTVASGDSLTVRNASLTSKVWLIECWAHNQATGALRIRSPKLHDNVDAIRARVISGQVDPQLPLGAKVQLFPQDTLIHELAGSAVGGQIESLVTMLYYEDLPGQAGRFIDIAALRSRQKTIIGQRIAITYPTVVGYGGARAINGDNDQFHANTDYAILGVTTDVIAGAITIKGADTGNLRVAVPGKIADFNLTSRWFYHLTDRLGFPLIPVVNSANKAGIIVEAISNQAGGTGNVTIWMAELTM